MKKFKHIKPASLEAAGSALRDETSCARAVAGGTDLLGTLKDKISPQYPDLLISLANTGLRYIKESPEGIRIGAMATLHEIETSPAVKEKFPLLQQAAHSVAAPQIRHQATIGGNLCQEPRCWYYRYPDNRFDCMRKGGTFCDALTGNNPYHSVFGAAHVCDTPCKTECPNETNIPLYFDMIRQGDLMGAAKVLLEVNPLAAATGRVCPHTCESGCNREKFEKEESVSIRDIERFLGDYILENAKELVGALPKATGKKIAIAGAGPSGLTAAFYLQKQGHSVTIYDDNEKPGGMLVYGIPAYRLPKDIVAKTAEVLKDMGVQFKQKVKLGKDITLPALQKEYDAVLLGIGAWASVEIGCPGEDTKGVVSGIDFLFQATDKKDIGMGKTVAVIGGGNTAMDSCRTALRLGAEKVYNFYRRTRVEMPADAEEITEAAEEGVDFRYLTAPVEIVKDAKGRVCKIKLQKMKLGEPDESGRRRPEAIQGETETVDVDTVIVAIGQGINAAGLDSIALNKKSEIIADRATYATNMDKVFAAGDAAIGPGTVVESVADARKAAQAIHEYLGGKAAEETCERGKALYFDPECLKESARLKMTIKPADKRNYYEEDVAGVQLEAIQREANRCFNCGCVAVSPSDVAPALIALGAEMITTDRTIPAKEFFRAGIETSTVLEKGELLKEILIHDKAAGNIQLYQKFRTRKTIDFPIAGLASNLSVRDGKIASAKLVFGAAAPVPYELTEVEAFLQGKKPDETVAAKAGELAVKAMLPLAENAFKVRVFRTFIKRIVRLAEKGGS